jgi:hypothetical protein
MQAATARSPTRAATPLPAGSAAVDRAVRGARPWWTKVDADAPDIAHAADEEIDKLGVEARAVLAGIWQERGSSELKVAGGFAAVSALLIEHGSAQAVLELVSRAVRDEVHHAEIAVDMAARYRGSDVVWPEPTSFPVPMFAPASAPLRATLLVIALCCINETLACGILEGQLAQATSPLTRAALQTVLADEIDHARAGWAHVASPIVTPAMRSEIAENWLVRLLNARLKDLVDEDSPFPGEEYPEHGILTRAARKKIVASALEAVVFPGWERAGISPAKARAWANETFQ